MRRAAVAVLATLAAGLIGLVVAAVVHRTPRAFTLGVSASAPVVPLNPGDVVCQQPIDVPAGAAFDSVVARLGTYHRAGSALRVTVDDPARRVIAQGRVPGGYPDIAQQPIHRVRLSRTVGAPRVSVCLRNVGSRRVAVYGNGDLAARTSTAVLDGRAAHVDVSLDFERSPRSIASLVPRMLARASLFRFSWLGPWAYVVLAVLVVVAGPLLLIRALAGASTGSELTTPDEARRRPPRPS